MRINLPAAAAALLAACALGAAAPAGAAGVCDVRFLRDGGEVRLTGTGAIKLDADLSFSDVRKSGPDTCRAHVRGNATYQLLGLPGGDSDFDHDMSVVDGKSTFARRGRQAEAGKSFDLRLLGLFGYPGRRLQEGARLPGETFQLSLGERGRRGSLDMPAAVVRIGEKTVGKRQAMDTALGRQQCWPVSYQRNTDPTMATFGSVTLPIPGMRSDVTDWFCPDAGLVMKQEIVQAGQQAVIEVTSVK